MTHEVTSGRGAPQKDAAPTVLVVEDDAAIGMLLLTIVEDAGFTVVGPVTSARQAREVLGETNVSAALLDVHLGERLEDDGSKLADLLCDLGIPFIFVTARSRESLQPALRSFAHVAKPVDADALIAQLRAHLP